jgi:amidase
MPPARTHRLLTLLGALATMLLISVSPAAAAAPVLDLESLTGPQAVTMLQDGDITSVELTRAYMTRIAALNKRGPGLNAVTQFNPDALKEAALADQRRSDGELLGPADGLPMLMKDLIDVKGMYTSAGNYSLRNSFPEQDAGLVKKLRQSGVVILGKLGLSEFANFFGSQHSGFSNLTGQVLNGLDTDAGPSGSSSGTGAATAAALSTLGIGTETSGSIISPSQANGIVGLRPTVGLVPGTGIAPISASQDTAGPMTRTVSEAALTLQSMAGYDPDNEAYYHGIWGPGVADSDVLPPVPHTLPNYMSALDLNFVNGKKIGYNGTVTSGAGKQAFDALVAAGAIMVPRPSATVGPITNPNFSILNYEAHRDITHYYQHLGPLAPIHSLEQEIADNQANAHEALKFGNGTHMTAAAIDVSDGSAESAQYRAALTTGKSATHKAIEDMMKYTNSDPSQPADPVIAILGSVPQGPRAGYPQLTIPMGYNATQRRTVNISVNGNAYDERNLIGVAYVIEQGTHLRQPASMVNPSMYRCAHTVPAPPFASRGGCNPDYDTVMDMIGGSAPSLPFSLETESAKSLQTRETTGTLSAETLTKAYLARIALTNAEGPAIQAVSDINTNAINEAQALDNERTTSGPRGPLHGIPVLLNDSMDVHGLPTTAGSIALQHSMPSQDAKLVAKLKAAGAIILGKTNVSELNGVFDSNMPEGYSSLGGQVLLPSDTDNNPGGSSAGAAAATASGLAAMTVGMETGTDTGSQMISVAGNNGVVALKPTVGRVSRAGVMPVAKSQDSPGPITETVYDAATQLQAIAGPDPDDPATIGTPAVPDYLSGLVTNALAGKRVAVTSSTTAPYPSVVTALTALGATTFVKTVGTPSPNPASIVPSEFKRDLNGYLAGTTGSGAKSLQAIIDYNTANPVEGLKFQQGELTAAQAIDLGDSSTNTTYMSNLTTGKASNAAIIDAMLNNGTPDDGSDDMDVVVVPSGNALVGIADRAGYPILTVPAGFGTGSAGRNPIGVTFIGRPFGEASLLADGYAYEQASNVRITGGPPSYTNPSMWRCVPYSTFFSPHHCNPGDLESDSATGATEFPVATSIGGFVAPTLELILGSTSTSLGQFIPGVAADYSASVGASLTSTGGDATLSVLDPSTVSPGHLVNGTRALASPLQVRATRSGGGAPGLFAPLGAATVALLGYADPVSNDPITIGFKQSIGASEPLRTGTYSKTLLFTASTTSP